MSAPPLIERERTEDAPITRSSIWHKDGSVVLQADNTQFRVHWGILALNSCFFRELQDLPLAQPNDQPSVEGCPIVELSSDASEDVENLLKALYTPTFLLQKALPFAVVATLIRLRRKYDFRDLLDTAAERLTFENPTILEEFDVLKTDGQGPYRLARILNHPGIFYDMLTLARENNIQSVLPCAYYRAVEHSNHLFDGISREDRTRASLAPIDQRRCARGREALDKFHGEDGYPLDWVYSKTQNDCSKPQCKDVRMHYLRQRTLHLYALSSPPPRLPSLCPSCHKQYLDSWTAGRKKLWEGLPKCFDLPPWAELTNDP
ncbi:hypothetical protein DFH08DRAFT_861737 [Mycena albidolilacea]|uniref:BTB domain-containing protein n=1 Tax=Mycena albidolilacea TaxID=1033008 RepID=A0AAD7A6D9_9AGAR|nr:hypothetical protein DFH08DRAFT_861737 [Mycena albidolilacea]